MVIVGAVTSLKPPEDVGVVGELPLLGFAEIESLGNDKSFVRFFLRKEPRVGIRA